MKNTEHQALIVDQFTRQAVPFSTAKTIADEKASQLLIDVSNAGNADTVLDVACGGGNVVCAFARVARHATGCRLERRGPGRGTQSRGAAARELRRT